VDDPLGFKNRCTHFDYDDWGEYFSNLSDKLGVVVPFIQGDAHKLDEYFAPGDYDTIIMGDIVEHLDDPYRAITQAAQICRALCLTIWEEWRNPHFGKGVATAQASLEKEARKGGYSTVSEMYHTEHPGCRPSDNVILPHLGHIWQFSDEMVDNLVLRVAKRNGMTIAFYQKVAEVVHEGHQVYNWLVYLVKE
jgi:SAM-dependent methyltransferase